MCYPLSLVHRFRQAFKKAAAAARTWLPGWCQAWQQRRGRPRAVAAALGSMPSLARLVLLGPPLLALVLVVLQQMLVQLGEP